MFGQLGEQVLILEDIGVWVEGGEGVEEEGGELCGHAGSGSLLSVFVVAMRPSSFL